MRKWLAIGLITFFVVFSLTPTIYEWNNRGRIKPIRYFELVHNFPTDYNLYLSRIREGKEGAWLATEKYTSEPHAGSLSQILYVLIGRAWDWSHGQTPYIWLAYHASRVFFGALFLWVVWNAVRWLFSHSQGGASRDKPVFFWQITAFLLVVTASTWPKFEWVGGYPRFGGYMSWWSVIDSLQRITFLPHVVLGQAILVFILWVVAGGFVRADKGHMGNWGFLGVIGLVLGIIFPPALLFIYGVLAVLFIWDLVDRGDKRNMGDRIKGKLIFGFVSAPSFIYYALLFGQYPWKRLVEFDVLHPTKFSFLEYFLALGPTLPLGIIGMFVAFAHRDEISRKLRVFAAWIIGWLAFLFLFAKIPAQSPTRFTEMAPQVPLGIFTAYLFFRLSRLRYLRYLTGIAAMVILLGLGSMYSSWLWQRDFVDHKLIADYPLVPRGAEVMYPLRDLIDAMMWLQVYTSRDAVVLSGQSTGNLIPVYSGNTVYVGHANTVNLEEKLPLVESFYRGDMPASQARTWLDASRISYVFFGPEEAEFSTYSAKELTSLYPFLEKIYQNSRVYLYRVGPK